MRRRCSRPDLLVLAADVDALRLARALASDASGPEQVGALALTCHRSVSTTCSAQAASLSVVIMIRASLQLPLKDSDSEPASEHDHVDGRSAMRRAAATLPA
jgi:hypothetical protein